MHKDPHLLVTRPVETHLGRSASDAAVHLGNGNGSPGLSLDLVEQPDRNARRKGEHVARIARQPLGKTHASVPKAHTERK